MKVKATLLSTAAALAIGGTAQAAQFQGWYLGLEGGANWVNDNNFSLTGNVCALEGTCSSEPNVTQFGKSNYDTGWAVLATVGYAWHNWRIELEGGYRHNKFSAVVVDPGDSTEGPSESITTVSGGRLTEYTIMANVLYDIALTDRLSFSIGAGAGGDNSHWKLGPLKDSQWDFAYQGLAGLNYALTRRLDLFLNYRYLVVTNPDYSASFGPISIHSDDYDKQTATLGLRYALWGPEEPPPPPPPPPAAPPPPPPPTSHFLIFFGFNKCNITSEADGVLSEAVSAAKSMGAAAITIVGHTDTSGSPRYNQKLSECRSHAAKTNMVRKGIPDGAISTSGKGETELMVQTGDGVKEPQNRRATVDLQ